MSDDHAADDHMAPGTGSRRKRSRRVGRALLGIGKSWLVNMTGIGLVAQGYRNVTHLLGVLRGDAAERIGQNRWDSYADYVRAYRLTEPWLAERRRQTRMTGMICYLLSAVCLAEMIDYGLRLMEGEGGLLPLIGFPAFASLFFAVGLTNMWRSIQIRLRQFIPFPEFLGDARMWKG